MMMRSGGVDLTSALKVSRPFVVERGVACLKTKTSRISSHRVDAGSNRICRIILGAQVQDSSAIKRLWPRQFTPDRYLRRDVHCKIGLSDPWIALHDRHHSEGNVWSPKPFNFFGFNFAQGFVI